jgi:hypothetical protein
MTFYIFGDSYGDPNSASDNTYELWCEMLNEPVINNCRGSSGPQYSLRKINEFLKQITHNDKIIFIMSDRNRLNFPFIKNIDDSSSAVNLFKHPNSPLSDKEEYLRSYNYEINLIYTMFDKEIKILPFLIILYLNYISQKTGCKILIIPAFSSLKFGYPYSNFINPFYLNSNMFKVLNIDLYQISKWEFMNDGYSQEIEDKRRCHLSYCNHIVLFNIISNFFYDTTLSEIFHKNLYNVEKEDVHERFIYG